MSKPNIHYSTRVYRLALCGRLISNPQNFTDRSERVTCKFCKTAIARLLADHPPKPAYQFDEADHKNPEQEETT